LKWGTCIVREGTTQAVNNLLPFFLVILFIKGWFPKLVGLHDDICPGPRSISLNLALQYVVHLPEKITKK
jgi:hypothetical protein